MIILLAMSTVGVAQEFTPYSSFGLQLSRRFSRVNAIDNTNYYYRVNGGRPDRGFELIAQYDRGVKKWFGLGAGVGLSSIGSQVSGAKHLYYAVVPFRLQLKMGGFWVEPGIENRLFLWLNDDGNTNYVNDQTINPYHLAGTLTFRVKLFRGLSLHGGFSASLTRVIDLKGSDYSQQYGEPYYSSIAGVVGVRYIFNQPYKKSPTSLY